MVLKDGENGRVKLGKIVKWWSENGEKWFEANYKDNNQHLIRVETSKCVNSMEIDKNSIDNATSVNSV